MRRVLKNKFFAPAMVFLAGLAVFALFSFALAADTNPVPAASGSLIGSISNWAIVKAVGMMGYVFGWIASIVFGIGGFLIDFALGLNNKILSTDNAVVQTGWGIVRNFANLGFILFIIIIAFATIFRMQSYGLKKTLWRLIVAALLVNFSLVMAGAFINVSDLVAEFFLDRATLNGPGNFATVLADAIGSQALMQMKRADISPTGIANTVGAGSLTVVGSIFFIAGFTLLGGLTLLAVATMFLIRYVMLSILLIMSPGALLMWILPGTQKHWQKWWSEFIKWVIFAPIVLFFLYLTVVTLQGMKGFTNSITAQQPTSAAGASRLTFGVEVIGNLAVMLGLMVGGLIFASKQSGTGGKIFYGWAQGAGNWAKARGKRFGRDIGDRARNIGRKTDNKGVTTTGLQRMGSTLAGAKILNKIPGVRGAAQGLGGAVAQVGVVKPKGEEVEKYRKDNLESLTKDAIKTMAENPTLLLDPIKAAAVAKQAAKKGVDLDEKVWQKHIENAERLGTTADIYSARPDLAATRINDKHRKDAEEELKKQKKEITPDAVKKLAELKAIEKATSGIKIENITNLQTSVIEWDPEADKPEKSELTDKKISALLSLSTGHLAKLGSSDDTKGQRENIERILAHLDKNKHLIPKRLMGDFKKLKKFTNKNGNYNVDFESEKENKNWTVLDPQGNVVRKGEANNSDDDDEEEGGSRIIIP